MPISATFAADFTLFQAQVSIAQTKLKAFETDTVQVAKSLTALENSISGASIVQAATVAAEAVDRLGGVSKLTYAELQRLGSTAQEAVEKLTALGQKVPTGMQDLADRARGAAEETARLGNTTKDAAGQTSAWGAALTTLTGTFGALTLQRVIDEVIRLGKEVFDTAEMLQRLRDRTDINVETLQRLKKVGSDTGVSIEAMANAINTLQRNLGEASPETAQAFEDLGLHLADIKNLSMEDAFFATAKALKETGDQTKIVTDGQKLMGKSFVETLPAIKKGFDDTKDSAELWSRSTVKVLADTKQSFSNAGDYIKAGFGQVVVDVLTGTTEAFRRAKDSIDALVEGTLAKQAPNFWKQILPPSVPKDLDTITEKSDALAKAYKIQFDALAEIADLSVNWAVTLKDLNPATVDLAKNALAHGAAQKTVVEAYGLTAGAVKELAAQQKVWADFEKESHDLFIKHTNDEADAKKKQTATMNDTVLAGLKEIQSLEAAANDAKQRATLSATDYQIAKIYERADAEVKASKAVGDQLVKVTALIMGEADRQAKGVAASATAALDVVAKKGMDTLALLDLVGRQVQKGMAVDVVGNAAAVGGPKTGMQAPIYVAPPIFSRDTGGLGVAGQSYYIGTGAQPELFTPSTNGSFTPSTRSAGVVQNITIHVNGTAADVARQVSDEIMRAAMRGQQFGAS